ncbi:hypothetical protein [Pseudomonas poae]|uniref:hypothetical protein n=1 Tax=Pseudomonas poae TaxID=200451 RepID=UPI000F03FC47|nr:hypothetical protein [Pseudomonas poae]MBC3197851.1 hypothetical protein [Pseudomonas poae]
MLDRTNNDRDCIEAHDIEWLALSEGERNFVGLYRQLNDEDRQQLKRLTEALVTVPKETAVR